MYFFKSTVYLAATVWGRWTSPPHREANWKQNILRNLSRDSQQIEVIEPRLEPNLSDSRFPIFSITWSQSNQFFFFFFKLGSSTGVSLVFSATEPYCRLTSSHHSWVPDAHPHLFLQGPKFPSPWGIPSPSQSLRSLGPYSWKFRGSSHSSVNCTLSSTVLWT